MDDATVSRRGVVVARGTGGNECRRYEPLGDNAEKPLCCIVVVGARTKQASTV